MGGFGKARKKARELHPTTKPVALVAEALLDVTAPDDIILDPFGGSGSTLIAAERIGRSARLVEYEPRYVDRTIARWERMTGLKAELVVSAPPDNPEDETPEGIRLYLCVSRVPNVFFVGRSGTAGFKGVTAVSSRSFMRCFDVIFAQQCGRLIRDC